MRPFLALPLSVVLLAACGSDEPSAPDGNGAGGAASSTGGAAPGGGPQGGASTGGASGGAGGDGGGAGGEGTPCISCDDVILMYLDPADLCTKGSPSSADKYDALHECGCAADKCGAECGDNICIAPPPSQACADCVQTECPAEFGVCLNDADGGT